MEEIVLNLKDYRHIKKIIKKYNYQNIKVGLNLDNQVIYQENDVDITNYSIKEKTYWFILIINALNIKDKRKKYEYIYYRMCDFLDQYVCSLCDFSCDRCIANRLKKSVHPKDGCCYFHNIGFCPYFKDKKCTKKAISCKLFMCEYIEKKYRFKSIPKTYPLLNLFFNRRQKAILKRSYRMNLEDFIEELLACS